MSKAGYFPDSEYGKLLKIAIRSAIDKYAEQLDHYIKWSAPCAPGCSCGRDLIEEVENGG